MCIPSLEADINELNLDDSLNYMNRQYVLSAVTHTMSDSGVEIPQREPLEIVKQGRVWLVKEYTFTNDSTETFSTHDSQIEAVRSAKTRMDDDFHPCTLRWESADSVSNIYWNPLYERVDLEYDDLCEFWSIAPAAGTCAIAVHDDWRDASDHAKEIQYNYNFKHLRVYGQKGEDYEERDHRYLRYDITSSGVRFDRSKIETHPSVESDDDEDEDDEDEVDIETEQAATPSMLGVSIPDVTKVEFVDTDGVINRYATPWGDGTRANVVVLSRKYAADESAREAFETYRAPWKRHADSPAIATIYEEGTDPTPYAAYRSGEFSLWEVGHDMSLSERLNVLETVARALRDISGTVCGVRPENVRLRTTDGSWRVTVANWGIEWAVSTAIDGAENITSFTTPEQLRGELHDRTAVYQLGALAYWLLCETVPVEDDPDRILAGDITPPSPVRDVSDDVIGVLERALAHDPSERYESPEAFYRILCENL
jgi:hypothetical protein